MQEKKKAWVYTRIDAPEDSTGSLKHQDQKLTEYAEHMAWEIVGHSQDLGPSWDMDRAGLSAATDAIIEGQVGILVISNPSRISRDKRDARAYAETLTQFGGETYSPEWGRIEALSAPVKEERNQKQGQELL